MFDAGVPVSVEATALRGFRSEHHWSWSLTKLSVVKEVR